MPEITEEYSRIVARLDALTIAENLYLNPDLTLSRRRLVPMAAVSGDQ